MTHRLLRPIAAAALALGLLAGCAAPPPESFGSPRPVARATWRWWCWTRADLERTLHDFFTGRTITAREFLSDTRAIETGIDRGTDRLAADGSTDIAAGVGAVGAALARLRAAVQDPDPNSDARAGLVAALAALPPCGP